MVQDINSLKASIHSNRTFCDPGDMFLMTRTELLDDKLVPNAIQVIVCKEIPKAI